MCIRDSSLGANGYYPVQIGRLHFNGIDQYHGFSKRFVGDHNRNHLGSPKKTKIASPINLSIVPPHLIATLDIFVRYWVRSSVKTSGSNL